MQTRSLICFFKLLMVHKKAKRNSMPLTCLITGGAGYIGSHISHALHHHGYRIIIIDDLRQGQSWHHCWGTFIHGSIADKSLLDTVFLHQKIDLVIHCAASTEVGLSTKNPLSFYENNVSNMITLLRAMQQHQVKKIIFSSSCAVYGIPQTSTLAETHPCNPINPYGSTKLIGEKLLADCAQSYGLQSIIFRYFNVAGADYQAGLGEWHEPETHLIPLLFRAAREKKPFFVYGTDYATIDGSCIRDFVHVQDIAQAHLAAIKYLYQAGRETIFNIGSGIGYSVLQIIKAVEKEVGHTIDYHPAPGRSGDPAILIASNQKARQELNWQPRQSNLETMIKSAYQSYTMHQAIKQTKELMPTNQCSRVEIE